MKLIPYDESVVLKTGEKDIDKTFRLIEKLLPLPKEEKHAILVLMTYILCM